MHLPQRCSNNFPSLRICDMYAKFWTFKSKDFQNQKHCTISQVALLIAYTLCTVCTTSYAAEELDH